MLTCDAFEWAVTAAMSIGAHLAERNYSLRFLDSAGAPAFRNSPSAPDPEAEEYTGTAGLQSIAESLAAIQLSGPHHAHPHRNRAQDPRRQPRPQEATPGPNAASTAHEAVRTGGAAAAGNAPQDFDDALMDKLSAHRPRGPVLAILGSLSLAEARALSPAAGFGANAFALLVTDQAQDFRRDARGPGGAAAGRMAGRGGFCPELAARRMGSLRRGRPDDVRCSRCPPRRGGPAMTLAPQRSSASSTGTAGTEEPTVLSPGAPSRREGPGAQPWVMGTAVAVAVAGAALGFNGVLRGWAWYSPVFSTVLSVAFSMAMLRSLRARTWLVAAGGLAALIVALTFIFFRQHSIAGFIPSPETMNYLGRFLRRASETVLAESTPVAPNAGIVMLICAVLGLLVILIDALAFPLALPATSGLGILAILVVPAIIKPQSVGVLGFVGAAVGYLLILGCSHWFTPDARTLADTARNPGQLRRGAVTAAAALTVTLLLQPVIPGFDQGTFPQGSRLNPFGSATGLNPMISLGNSLRSPSGDGRITFATNAPTTPYLRSVTVDSFDGDSWSPDDRESTRQPGTGRIESGLDTAATELRVITAVNTGQYTSPYLPSPYAPEAVNGLTGRWSWDPATLSIKGVDTNSRDQQYVVTSVTPQLTAALLARASGPVRGVPEQFLREPSNVPEVVRSTAETVTAGASTPYARAMAIQRYLRSTEFSYSLQSPVQGGYDGNGLSVLADFLAQKSGYCIHFASAMAVMARLEGIPSRIAVGYAPGRPTGATVAVSGQGPLPEFEVDARDAHAWPELYFQGVGWVAFEPTPSRGRRSGLRHGSRRRPAGPAPTNATTP